MFNKNIETKDFMHIMITHKCENNCPFCFDGNHGFNDDISIDNFQRILDVAKEKRLKEITFVGGEPTMHPDVLLLAKMVKDNNFKLIVTTNYTKPDVVKQLDRYADSFNISWYHQKELPNPKEFTADLTLSALIFKGQLDSKEKLDEFIDKYGDKYILKFATLVPFNDWCQERCNVDFLDDIKENVEKFELFGQIEGMTYRNCIIKRHDRVLSEFSQEQSLIGHTNGDVNQTWEEGGNKVLCKN